MKSRKWMRGLWAILVLGIALIAVLLQHSSARNMAGSLPPVPSSTVKPSSTLLRASTLAPAHAWVPSPTLTPGRQISSPTPTLTPTSEITGEPPEYFYIANVNSHKQWFSIGCEASAAVDWAGYFGVPINEREFQALLPKSDNPDFGFVGNVDGPWGLIPPNDYGVHATPVAELLRWYGLNAAARKGMTLEDLEVSIAQSKPVIAWVVGNVTYGNPVEYMDQEGNITIVAAYEHVVIVTGYNFESVRYLNNGEEYVVSTNLFLTSWGVLGNMAVVMGNGDREN